MEPDPNVVDPVALSLTIAVLCAWLALVVAFVWEAHCKCCSKRGGGDHARPDPRP